MHDPLMDFECCMARCRLNESDALVADFDQAAKGVPDPSTELLVWAEFMHRRAHILSRGNEQWPADRILLQLALEHADDSPVTRSAEEWLKNGSCDWFWLWNTDRPEAMPSDPCVAALEGHTDYVDGAMLLSDGPLLSWSCDGTLRMWGMDGQPLGKPLNAQAGSIHGAAELPDRRILSWTNDGTMHLWHSGSLKLLHTVRRHRTAVAGVNLLDDGRVLTWSQNGTICLWNFTLWDVKSGPLLHVLEGIEDEVRESDGLRGDISYEYKWNKKSVDIMDDGRVLSIGWDNSPRLWDPESGIISIWRNKNDALILGFMKLSHWEVASWAEDGTLCFWDIRSGDLLETIQAHEGPVGGALVLDGRVLLTWQRSPDNEDGTLKLWNMVSHRLICTMEGHEGSIRGALALPDKKLLTWSNDLTLRLWNSRTGWPLLEPLVGHSNPVLGVVPLANGRFASYSGEAIFVWDGRSVHPLASLNTHSSEVTGLLPLADDRLLSMSCNGSMHLLDPGKGILSADAAAFETGIDTGTILLPGNRLLSWTTKMMDFSDSDASFDSIMRIWDCDSGALLHKINNHGGQVNGALVTPYDRLLTWMENGCLNIWDLETGSLLQTLYEHQGAVHGALITPDECLLSWSEDGTLKLWDVEIAHLLQTFDEHQGSVNGALVVQDNQVVSWSGDSSLRFWKTGSSTSERVMREPDVTTIQSDPEFADKSDFYYGITEVMLLESGRLVSQSSAYTCIWDVETGTLLHAISSELCFLGLMELPDGKLFVDELWEDPLIYDAETGRILHKLKKHEDNDLSNFRLLTNGNILLEDKWIQVWDHSTGEELDCIPEQELADKQAEWYDTIGYPELKVQGHQGWCRSNNCGITPPGAVWHSDSRLRLQHVLDNGTLVCVLDNGKPCFPKLYRGNQRVALD